jgi:hypothetical protein
MFPVLLAHLQEVLYRRRLVYCVRVMSVGCTRLEWNSVPLQSWCSKQTKLARNITSAVGAAIPEDEQVMLEICRDS